jgi:hypothetical protein
LLSRAYNYQLKGRNLSDNDVISKGNNWIKFYLNLNGGGVVTKYDMADINKYLNERMTRFSGTGDAFHVYDDGQFCCNLISFNIIFGINEKEIDRWIELSREAVSIVKHVVEKFEKRFMEVDLHKEKLQAVVDQSESFDRVLVMQISTLNYLFQLNKEKRNLEETWAIIKLIEKKVADDDVITSMKRAQREELQEKVNMVEKEWNTMWRSIRTLNELLQLRRSLENPGSRNIDLKEWYRFFESHSKKGKLFKEMVKKKETDKQAELDLDERYYNQVKYKYKYGGVCKPVYRKKIYKLIKRNLAHMELREKDMIRLLQEIL